jgi:tetratricopeptide (TPR) repeat protein
MTKSKHMRFVVPWIAAGMLVASRAVAQTPEAIARATEYFDAGAQAYKAGQYLVAAEAFLKANDTAPNPALLFSAAQAYRRQFLAEPAKTPLHHAISLYREYLKVDKKAKRREDAMQAIGALVPFEARFPAEGADAEDKAAKQTRILLTSAAEGAEASVDNGPFVAMPAVPKVSPGQHAVKVRALGYQQASVSVTAISNELLPLHVALQPKPARLAVRGTSGARVEVDGLLRATLPLRAPIALTPGAHFVSVTLNGHKPWSEVVEAKRDAEIALTADLAQTRQRIAAWSTISVGAAGAIAAGVLGGLAIARQSEATALRDKQVTTPLTPSERDTYNAAIAARDGLSKGAAVAGAVSALVIATGLGLFVVDKPDVLPPNDERLRAPGQPPKVELLVGLLSIGVRGSF